MTVAQAIEHTKNKKGMKVSFTGIASRISQSGRNGALDNGTKFMVSELGKHYDQARSAWLEGDLETVAEFFGLYTARE